MERRGRANASSWSSPPPHTHTQTHTVARATQKRLRANENSSAGLLAKLLPLMPNSYNPMVVHMADGPFGCEIGPARTVSAGMKIGVCVSLLRRHHPRRVRLQWSTRFCMGSTKLSLPSTLKARSSLTFRPSARKVDKVPLHASSSLL